MTTTRHSAARHIHHLIQDAFAIAISIVLAVILVKTGLIESFIGSLHGTGYLAIFVAGMFFTSVFTTAPAIVVLAALTQQHNIALVAALGGLGAMIGDYIIFRFVRDRVGEDFEYIFGLSKHHRIPHIFRTRLFHWFAPFIGALIIASPLPDELGVAILGLSKTNERFFLLISFAFNALGILLIGSLSGFIL